MSLRRNVIANYLGQGWAAAMGFVFVPEYVRLLGIEAYGLIGVYAILQAGMALLDLGLTPTLNREMARLRAGAHTPSSIRNLLRSLETVYSLIALVAVIGMWFGAPWLAARWLDSPGITTITVVHAIRIMGFVLATRWLEQIYRGALQGMQDLVWLNTVQAVLATLRWGGACIALLISPTIDFFFGWQGCISILTVVVLIRRTYQLLPASPVNGRFDLRVLREVQGFATGMFGSTVLSLLLTQSDKLVISKLLPLEALGAYTMASTATGGLLQLILPMNTAVFPRLTEQVARNDLDALGRTYLISCQWMAAVLVPPAFLMAFFAEPCLYAWTGDAGLASSVAPVLTVLALGTLCNGLMNLPYMLQLAHGWTALAIQINVAAVLLIVPSMIWAVPRYGVIGAACAWLALNAGYVLISAHLMHRRLLPALKWRWYAVAIALPAGAGAVAGTVVAWALPQPHDRMSAIAVIAVAGLALAAAVATALPSVRTSIRHGSQELLRLAARSGR